MPPQNEERASVRLLGANPIDRRRRELEIANLCLAVETVGEGLKSCLVQCFVSAGLERPRLARALIARSSTGDLAALLRELFAELRPDAADDRDAVSRISERAVKLDAAWLRIARDRYVVGPLSAGGKRRALMPAFETARATRPPEERPLPIPDADALRALREEAEGIDLELLGVQLAIQSGRAVDDAIRIARSERHPFSTDVPPGSDR